MGLRRAHPLALLVFSVLLAACNGTAAAKAPPSTTTALPVVQSGGTVTIAVPALPTNYNPMSPQGASAITQLVMEQVWPQAFVTSNSDQSVLGPGLLSQAELVSVKPQTVVYDINSKARWSNGTPITAADFIYEWHEMLSGGSDLPISDAVAGYFDIKSITGSNDGKSVTVVYSEPFADWEALFSDLIPSKIAERHGFVDAFSGFHRDYLVSGGPFEVTKVMPGKELVLSRNPLYWGAQPHLDHIDFVVEKTTHEVIQGLRSGSIDIAELQPSRGLQDAAASTPALEVSTSPSGTLWQLAFNLANPVLSKLDVREAIAKSIDRHELAATTIGFFATYGTVATNRLFPLGAPGAQANDSAYESTDVSGADALLTAAGYPLDSQGLVTSRGSGTPLVLSLLVPAGNSTLSSMSAVIKAQLLNAGITVVVKEVDEKSLLSRLAPQGHFEMALLPYADTIFPTVTASQYSDPVDPSTPASPLSTSGNLATSPLITPIGTEPGAASSGEVTRDVLDFDDPTIDKLFVQASQQLNAISEDNLYNQIDADLWNGLPTLPLFQMPTSLVNRISVVNVSNNGTWAGPMWDAEDWAIELHVVPTSTTP